VFGSPIMVVGTKPTSPISVLEQAMLRRIVLAFIVMVCAFGQFGVFSQAAALAADPKVGDTVLALWELDQMYFIATVVEKSDAGFLVVFEDGDTATLPAAKTKENTLKVGSKVTSRWTDGQYYPGTIAKAVGRAFYIKYDDGEERWVPWSWIAQK
jgi:hypothetical protein